MNRVAITGIGAVTPLGNDFRTSWTGVKQGFQGVGRLNRLDTSGLPWTLAGEIKGFIPELFLNPKEIIRLDPFIQYAAAAASMAIADAGLIETMLSNAGVIVGSSRGGITALEKEMRKMLFKNAKPSVSPYLMPSSTISMAASFIAQKNSIKGECIGISNACASGANAIGEAFRRIKHGYSKIVLAGGTEAPLCRLCFEGYGVSGALSKGSDNLASKPFDKNRDGFVLAEGACIVVLEEYEAARQRGARIYAEVSGYSAINDAFHITKPDVDGEASAIKQALSDAGIHKEYIGHVNAHGTSTVLGDLSESKAINAVFGPKIPVTALKSMTGHMLAASGAFESACTAMSLYEGVIPATVNVKGQDALCSINLTTRLAKSDSEFAVSNSFGFGGVNAVLVFKKTIGSYIL
ncbi:MAG: beta-ketoacyl-[acyl-carrier-protein] synthase family protein [Nitrospirae bacterium]|nr:beta-ketoacyl-[acyl-carrier-protein] synthase family protein [Nitrospirota bacterium]